ncbi:MAG: hypothetical protein HY007_02155 [Candidatus Sungbacteria bacterium]|nr:hypothetical protein [Candidatus Sungbacteria bacterium]
MFQTLGPKGWAMKNSHNLSKGGNKMGAVDRFLEISLEPKFAGWPLVGEYELGERIPFFGQVLNYKLETGNGVEDYTSLLRHFGWVVVFGVTSLQAVVTLVQWKPGHNRAGWELPPGGIGRVRSDATHEEILTRTQEFYLRETGYAGGQWTRLGEAMIETGKYRGSSPDDHGLPAHMYIATDLERVAEARKPNPNEIMETLLVPLDEFWDVIRSGLFKECSALPCALLALAELGIAAPRRKR